MSRCSDQQDSRTTLEKLERSGTGGVVVVGPQHRLQAILAAAAALNFTNFRWVLVPTGPLQERIFQGNNIDFFTKKYSLYECFSRLRYLVLVYLLSWDSVVQR